MRLFLALILISFNVFAAKWTDLESNRIYRLSQTFQLQTIDRSRTLLDFRSGERFQLAESTALDMINVTMFSFYLHNCPGPALKTDMAIIAVKATSPVVEIGAQVDKCRLEIFIENKDLMTKSFFD